MDDCFVWGNSMEWEWLFIEWWFMCFFWYFVFFVSRISVLKLCGEVESWGKMFLNDEWVLKIFGIYVGNLIGYELVRGGGIFWKWRKFLVFEWYR